MPSASVDASGVGRACLTATGMKVWVGEVADQARADILVMESAGNGKETGFAGDWDREEFQGRATGGTWIGPPWFPVLQARRAGWSIHSPVNEDPEAETQYLVRF